MVKRSGKKFDQVLKETQEVLNRVGSKVDIRGILAGDVIKNPKKKRYDFSHLLNQGNTSSEDTPKQPVTSTPTANKSPERDKREFNKNRANMLRKLGFLKIPGEENHISEEKKASATSSTPNKPSKPRIRPGGRVTYSSVNNTYKDAVAKLRASKSADFIRSRKDYENTNLSEDEKDKRAYADLVALKITPGGKRVAGKKSTVNNTSSNTSAPANTPANTTTTAVVPEKTSTPAPTRVVYRFPNREDYDKYEAMWMNHGKYKTNVMAGAYVDPKEGKIYHFSTGQEDKTPEALAAARKNDNGTTTYSPIEGLEQGINYVDIQNARLFTTKDLEGLRKTHNYTPPTKGVYAVTDDQGKTTYYQDGTASDMPTPGYLYKQHMPSVKGLAFKNMAQLTQYYNEHGKKIDVNFMVQDSGDGTPKYFNRNTPGVAYTVGDTNTIYRDITPLTK